MTFEYISFIFSLFLILIVAFRNNLFTRIIFVIIVAAVSISMDEFKEVIFMIPHFRLICPVLATLVTIISIKSELNKYFAPISIIVILMALSTNYAMLLIAAIFLIEIGIELPLQIKEKILFTHLSRKSSQLILLIAGIIISSDQYQIETLYVEFIIKTLGLMLLTTGLVLRFSQFVKSCEINNLQTKLEQWITLFLYSLIFISVVSNILPILDFLASENRLILNASELVGSILLIQILLMAIRLLSSSRKEEFLNKLWIMTLCSILLISTQLDIHRYGHLIIMAIISTIVGQVFYFMPNLSLRMKSNGYIFTALLPFSPFYIFTFPLLVEIFYKNIVFAISALVTIVFATTFALRKVILSVKNNEEI